MAIGVVILSLRGRYKLAITFAVINAIQVILGLIIVIWSIYMCFIFSPKLLSEEWEVNYVFGVTGLFAILIIIHFLLGLAICYKCYKQAHKKSTKNLLFVWTMLGVNLIINLIILSTIAVKVRKHIVQSMHHSLQRGIHNYLKDPMWKMEIDRLQIDMECCGLNSYKEWHEFMWLNNDQVREETDVVKRLRTSKERLHLPVTPWSCCRTDFPMQCLHDPLQQTESEFLWKKEPNTVLDSIYTTGCLQQLRIPIQMAVNVFVAIFTLSSVLFLIILIISRYLYTSSTNAIILKDPEGLAPGWFFGKGDFGYKRGKTAHEIMMQRSLEGHACATCAKKCAPDCDCVSKCQVPATNNNTDEPTSIQQSVSFNLMEQQSKESSLTTKTSDGTLPAPPTRRASTQSGGQDNFGNGSNDTNSQSNAPTTFSNDPYNNGSKLGTTSIDTRLSAPQIETKSSAYGSNDTSGFAAPENASQSLACESNDTQCKSQQNVAPQVSFTRQSLRPNEDFEKVDDQRSYSLQQRPSQKSGANFEKVDDQRSYSLQQRQSQKSCANLGKFDDQRSYSLQQRQSQKSCATLRKVDDQRSYSLQQRQSRQSGAYLRGTSSMSIQQSQRQSVHSVQQRPMEASGDNNNNSNFSNKNVYRAGNAGNFGRSTDLVKLLKAEQNPRRARESWKPILEALKNDTVEHQNASNNRIENDARNNVSRARTSNSIHYRQQ